MTVTTQQHPAVLQNSVVVFSKAYLPLARVHIKRAVVLLVTGQAETLDFGETQIWEVRSPSTTLQISEHIRLLNGNPERNWKLPPVNSAGSASSMGHLRSSDSFVQVTAMSAIRTLSGPKCCELNQRQLPGTAAVAFRQFCQRQVNCRMSG